MLFIYRIPRVINTTIPYHTMPGIIQVGHVACMSVAKGWFLDIFSGGLGSIHTYTSFMIGYVLFELTRHNTHRERGREGEREREREHALPARSHKSQEKRITTR